MKANTKSKKLDSLITFFMGKDRKEVIKNGDCMTCDAKLVHESLRNGLSRREYRISGMCQECQDEVFA